jgi:hypothetical protein
MPVTKFFDITNHRFGKLIVKCRATELGVSPIKWTALCDCGNLTTVTSCNLRSGSTKSCGCLRKEVLKAKFRTHGQHGSPTWYSWISMKSRCNNPKASQYELYGGRGITICERWDKFENFLEDMGERPNGKTLDRINVNKGYEPSNCKWSTKKEQAQNRRKLKLINKDSLMNFLQMQQYLTTSQREKIVENFFKGVNDENSTNE